MRQSDHAALLKAQARAAKAEGRVIAPLPSGGHIYVIECDVYELPEIYERRAELVPARNNYYATDSGDGIFQGEQLARKNWYDPSARTWEDAKRVLLEGWPEGAQRARKLAEDVARTLPEPESAVRRPRWGDEGDEVDRDRLYAGGVDTCWRTTTKVTRRAPRVIRIAGNWSLSCFHTAEQLAWNGAALVALVDVLEGAGYGTEVMMAFPASHGWDADSHTTMPVVRVKSAGDPLDLNSLAAVAGNASIFRSYGFLMSMTSDRKIGSGLGSPRDVRGVWTKAAEAGIVERVDVCVEASTDITSAKRQLKMALHELFPYDMPHPDSGKVREHGDELDGAERMYG